MNALNEAWGFEAKSQKNVSDLIKTGMNEHEAT